MPKFRKKPVEIEAFEWVPGQFSDWPQWAKDELKHWDFETGMVVARTEPCKRKVQCQGEYLFIQTLEGTHRADPGDWIIRGIKGELYPCKPDIFAATYDPA